MPTTNIPTHVVITNRGRDTVVPVLARHTWPDHGPTYEVRLPSGAYAHVYVSLARAVV